MNNDELRTDQAFKREVEEQQASRDFTMIAGTQEGRRFIKRLLSECSVYQSTFTGDALSSAHREGKRSVGLWALEQFNYCPEFYIKFLTEKQNND